MRETRALFRKPNFDRLKKKKREMEPSFKLIIVISAIYITD